MIAQRRLSQHWISRARIHNSFQYILYIRRGSAAHTWVVKIYNPAQCAYYPCEHLHTQQTKFHYASVCTEQHIVFAVTYCVPFLFVFRQRLNHYFISILFLAHLYSRQVGALRATRQPLF